MTTTNKLLATIILLSVNACGIKKDFYTEPMKYKTNNFVKTISRGDFYVNRGSRDTVYGNIDASNSSLATTIKVDGVRKNVSEILCYQENNNFYAIVHNTIRARKFFDGKRLAGYTYHTSTVSMSSRTITNYYYVIKDGAFDKIYPYSPQGIEEALADKPHLAKQIKPLATEWVKDHKTKNIGTAFSVGSILPLFLSGMLLSQKDSYDINVKQTRAIFFTSLGIFVGSKFVTIPFARKKKGVEKKIMKLIESYNKS
jgi:hypothetical protein